MKRLVRLASLVAVGFSSAAGAAELPNEAPDGKRWMSCFVRIKDASSNFAARAIVVGGYWLVDVPADSRTETQNRLRDIWVKEYMSRIPSEFPGKVAAPQYGGGVDARCNSFKSRGEWASFVAHIKDPVTSTSTLRSDFVPSFAEGWVSTREHARGYTGTVASSAGVMRSSPGEKPKTSNPEPRGTVDIVAGSKPSTTTPNSAAEAEKARAEAKAAREAEFQAKLAAHQAEVADYQRKVEAREAETARQQAAHAAAQEQARQAQEAHQSKMASFQRVLEEQGRRQREYEAALAQNNRCRAGDQQACADIKAGRIATPEAKLADADRPATSDDDARTCVTEPVVSASSTFEGQTQAVVFNGCRTSVDVRVCLLRAGGWNCGMTWGLKPQERWTHTTFQAQGGIFWDARINGTDRPLASPGGN